MSAQSTQTSDILFARQPIYDRDATRRGFELLFRQSANAANAPAVFDGEAATRSVLVNAFSEADIEVVCEGNPAFVNFTEQTIIEDLPFDPAFLVVEVLESVAATPAVFAALENLRGMGFKIALDTLDGGRIGIAAQALGIHRACLEESVKYSKEREQFGKPIGTFQGIAWKLADMATSLEANRMLVQKAAWLRDSGQPCTKECSMAKLAASRACNVAAQDAVQIHGGAGYTKEFPVERHYRDARITEIYEGATDIQRLVISRHL